LLCLGTEALSTNLRGARPIAKAKAGFPEALLP